MKESIIYGARCLIDGTWYIGKTDRSLEKRIQEHEHSASTNAQDTFHKTMREMGLRNFEWKELDRCPSSEVLEYEKKWIESLAAQSIDILNTSHARKSRLVSGILIKTKVPSRVAGFKSWQKKSAREWMQRSGKILPCINLTTGERFESLMKAERKGPDRRPGIRTSCETGRPTLNGNRYAFLDLEGNPVLKKGHEQSLPRTQRVKNLATGTIYNSVSEAAKSSGASSHMIQGCCIGKYKTARGMSFCYIDEDNIEILTDIHKMYQLEQETKRDIVYAAWRIDDNEREHIVYADSTKQLAEMININWSHIKAICSGARQHDHGWRVAYYNKRTGQLDLKEAHISTIRKFIKPVMCLDDEQVFSSPAEAARHYGLSGSQVALCCSGELKSTGRDAKEKIRRRFAYIDESGKPILTAKHKEPIEMKGDFRIFCPQTGKVYQSVAHCARETGIPQKRIRRHLKDSGVDLAGITLLALPLGLKKEENIASEKE